MLQQALVQIGTILVPIIVVQLCIREASGLQLQLRQASEVAHVWHEACKQLKRSRQAQRAQCLRGSGDVESCEGQPLCGRR